MADSRERIRAPPRDGREGFTSPRQVLRRLMLLSEGRQYREAATVVGRLGPSVLRSVVAELPMDILIEALPHSTYLLESFFNRLNAVVATPRPDVPCEAIMWHLVKLFSNPHETGLRQRCMKLAQAIGIWQPSLRDSLLARRKQLDQAIQGLGVHGLTADQTGSLISLHVALKNELQRHIDTYKTAIHKLEELSPVTAHQDPAQSSHQRLLAIGYGDIQQRLIDNKTLLTMLDKPALKQLAQLVENLSQRVQNDKEVLFCVGQIRRTDATANTEERPAAGLLMNYSRGCDTVLGLMGPIATLPPSSPTSNGCSSGGSDGYHSDSDIDETNSELVRQYSVTYSKNRIDTLDSLNSLPQLKHAHQLKAKILFSIIVLAFRACHGLKERKVLEVRRTLFVLDANDESTAALDRAVRQQLKETADRFPMGDVERQVANQVLSTLHEYPCLEACIPLIHYISDCVRLAWRMVNQTNPYYLDTDFTLGLLQPEKHERYPISEKRSDIIRAFLWPALMQNGHCVYKAVVAT
uniref:Mitochondria-eating protein n=2 Tax=Myzomyia TaxID=59140 RepID=A0A182M7M0_9DIPT